MTGRSATIAVLGCYALLLALIALNNLTDPGSNWPFVQHVLAMDTTFRSPRLMWRAITDPTLQGIALRGPSSPPSARRRVSACWEPSG